MNLIYEYGQNKEKKGISKEQERIIRNQLRSGMKAETISRTAEIPLSRVRAVERKIKR